MVCSLPKPQGSGKGLERSQQMQENLGTSFIPCEVLFAQSISTLIFKKNDIKVW